MSDRERLLQLATVIPDDLLPQAIALLRQLEPELIDDQTAAELRSALREPGDDLSHEELKRELGI